MTTAISGIIIPTNSSEQVNSIIPKQVATALTCLCYPTETLSSMCCPFYAKSTTLSLEQYMVDRMAKYSFASEECYVLTLVLVHRWAKATGSLTHHTVHRVTLTAFLISIKMHQDMFYSDRYYAKVGGVEIKDLLWMEGKFLQDVKWTLWVDPTVYRSCAQCIVMSPTSIVSNKALFVPEKKQIFETTSLFPLCPILLPGTAKTTCHDNDTADDDDDDDDMVFSYYEGEEGINTCGCCSCSSSRPLKAMDAMIARSTTSVNASCYSCGSTTPIIPLPMV
eukprot:PhF_6_TR33550/c2_g1_i3/m.48926